MMRKKTETADLHNLRMLKQLLVDENLFRGSDEDHVELFEIPDPVEGLENSEEGTKLIWHRAQ